MSKSSAFKIDRTAFLGILFLEVIDIKFVKLSIVLCLVIIMSGCGTSSEENNLPFGYIVEISNPDFKSLQLVHLEIDKTKVAGYQLFVQNRTETKDRIDVSKLPFEQLSEYRNHSFKYKLALIPHETFEIKIKNNILTIESSTPKEGEQSKYTLVTKEEFEKKLKELQGNKQLFDVYTKEKYNNYEEIKVYEKVK